MTNQVDDTLSNVNEHISILLTPGVGIVLLAHRIVCADPAI